MINDMTYYATDEDIALRAPADFMLICPRDQKVAVGVDGVFSPGNLWGLSSTTVDFQGRGVEPGQVIQLSKAGSGLRPDGEAFVIVSAVPGEVTLKRKGLPIGEGEPPSPPEGLTGVDFLIKTLRPQIGQASYELNHRFGIFSGFNVGGVSPIVDTRELRDAAVLIVLSRQYFAMSRELGTGPNGVSDTFAAKARATQAELDDLLARLAIHGNSSSYGPGATTRFSTRMSR